jgi:pimeloyl-ACP methyl ester carboxylesterase
MDGTGDLFSEFLEALGPGLQSVVVSYPPDQPLDYAALELLARARLPLDQPFVILGESFSGPIAISIAASAPHGLCGLVLCCSFVRNPRPIFGPLRSITSVLPVRRVPSALLSHALLGRFSSSRLRAALTQVLAQVSPAALRARIRAVLGVNVASQLSQVRVPVLYLRATEDRVVPRAASRLISRSLPRAKVAEFEAPHFLLQAAPVAAARQVRSFVQEVALGANP